MMELTIRLPKPHTKQAAIRASKAKRRVCCFGRRFGKTHLFAIVAVEGMLKGRRVLEAAPTADQTNAFWDACVGACAPAIAAGLIRKNETERTLETTWNTGRLRAKTAWNADGLRGDYADLLLLDEYALMDESAWSAVGAPMLLDNDGDAMFAFTPNRKNHAYLLHQKALADDSGRWAVFSGTSMDNPHLSTQALADITSDMSEDMYRQEILAEFLEGEGAVFRNIAACLTAPTDATPDAHKGHFLVMGVDWGKQADSTAISIVCHTCHAEVAIDRFNQIDYRVQRQRLQVLYDQWRPEIIVAESNAMGEPIIEELYAADLPVQGFATTPSTKAPLIENLALAFERAEFRWLPDRVWAAELEAYERTVSAVTGRSQYSAPAGLHDDCVVARALAIRPKVVVGSWA
jgi:hypothetical protein